MEWATRARTFLPNTMKPILGSRDPDRGIVELAILNLSVAKEVYGVRLVGYDGQGY